MRLQEENRSTLNVPSSIVVYEPIAAAAAKLASFSVSRDAAFLEKRMYGESLPYNMAECSDNKEDQVYVALKLLLL